MAEVVGIILCIFGLSSFVQSFRVNHTAQDIINARRDINSLGRTLWILRIMGVAAIGGGVYLLM